MCNLSQDQWPSVYRGRWTKAAGLSLRLILFVTQIRNLDYRDGDTADLCATWHFRLGSVRDAARRRLRRMDWVFVKPLTEDMMACGDLGGASCHQVMGSFLCSHQTLPKGNSYPLNGSFFRILTYSSEIMCSSVGNANLLEDQFYQFVLKGVHLSLYKRISRNTVITTNHLSNLLTANSGNFVPTVSRRSQ